MRPAEVPKTLRTDAAFSALEMFGLFLAIAVVAAAVVPPALSMIVKFRVTDTVETVDMAKEAVTGFAKRYGLVPTTDDGSRLDDLLIAAGMLESRFEVKVGDRSVEAPPAAAWKEDEGTWSSRGGVSQDGESRLVCLGATAGQPSASRGRNFRLGNQAGDLPSGARVISAVLVGVTAGEAHAISRRIDGEGGSASNTVDPDDAGKVVYAAPDQRGLTTAYIYIAHQ